jgi:uridylate kinase
MDNGLPILVFALEEGNIGRAARGERVGTIIQSQETATEGASR